MATLTVGSVFASHRIDAVVARGGMGVVYRATHLRLQRPVALKLIAPELADDPAFRERFNQEARIAASLDHANVVPVYEAGEEDGQLYLTMRFVEGTNLGTLIEREGPLTPLRATRIVHQVGDALDAAHARGLVHRDVKPANVLIAAGDHAYLSDFGLTKLAASTGMTKTGFVVGTIDYIAPEQVKGGPIDARTDVYALGCVLFHALTSHPPFVRDGDLAKMYAHVSDPPPSVCAERPDAPAGLDQVVRRAMAKEPAARFPSAGDLGEAATAAAEGRAPAGREHSVAIGAAATGVASRALLPTQVPADEREPGSPPAGSRRARPVVIAAVGVVLAALVVGAVILAGGGGKTGGRDAGHASTSARDVWAGQWTTNTGGLSLRDMSGSAGARLLRTEGGKPCSAPTSYYRGGYRDPGGQSGSFAGCTAGPTHLVGRYVGDPATDRGAAGDIDIRFIAPNRFRGTYTADSKPGAFRYTGVFRAHS